MLFEHQAIGVGVAQREIEIGAPGRCGFGSGIAGGCGIGGLQLIGEAFKTANPHSGKDIVPAGEVAIGRHRADPERGGDLPHRDLLCPALGKHHLRHIAKLCLKAGEVIIGERAGQRGSPDQCRS